MVMRSEQSTFPHVRLRESEGSRAKGATHQREEERHDVQRLYPARPDDDVAEGVPIERAGGEEDEHGEEGDGDEVKRDMAGLWGRVLVWDDVEDGEGVVRCLEEHEREGNT